MSKRDTDMAKIVGALAKANADITESVAILRSYRLQRDRDGEEVCICCDDTACGSECELTTFLARHPRKR